MVRQLPTSSVQYHFEIHCFWSALCKRQPVALPDYSGSDHCLRQLLLSLSYGHYCWSQPLVTATSHSCTNPVKTDLLKAATCLWWPKILSPCGTCSTLFCFNNPSFLSQRMLWVRTFVLVCPFPAISFVQVSQWIVCGASIGLWPLWQECFWIFALRTTRFGTRSCTHPEAE